MDQMYVFGSLGHPEAGQLGGVFLGTGSQGEEGQNGGTSFNTSLDTPLRETHGFLGDSCGKDIQ